MKRIIVVALLLLFSLLTSYALGVPPYQSRQSGNWSDASTWMIGKAGTITATVSSDTVTGSSAFFTSSLGSGNTLFDANGNLIGTVDNIINNDTLILHANAPATYSGAYSIGASGAPQFSDNVSVSGNMEVAVTSTSAACATLYLGRTSAPEGYGRIVFGTSGNLTVNSTLNWGTTTAADSGIVDMNGANSGYFILKGSIVSNANADLRAALGTVTFGATSGTQNIPALHYYSVIKQGTGAAQLTGGAVVGNQLSVLAGLFNLSSWPLTVNGSTQVSAGAQMTSSSGGIASFFGGFTNYGMCSPADVWTFNSGFQNGNSFDAAAGKSAPTYIETVSSIPVDTSFTTSHDVICKMGFVNYAKFLQTGGRTLFNGSSIVYARNDGGSCTFSTLEIDNPAEIRLDGPISCANLTLQSGTLNDNYSLTAKLTIADNGLITRVAGKLTAAPTFVDRYRVTYGAARDTTGPEIPDYSVNLRTLTIGDSSIMLGTTIRIHDTLRFAGSGSLELGNEDILSGDVSGAAPKTGRRISANLSANPPVTVGAGKGHCVVTGGIGTIQVQLPADETYVFPFGPTTTTYNPVILKNNTGGEITAQARVKLTGNPATANDAASCNRIWYFNYYNGGTGVDVSFLWDRNEAGAANVPANSTVWEYDGTSWKEMGGTRTPGTSSSYDTSTVTFDTQPDNYFTVGNTGALPMQLATISGSVLQGMQVQVDWTTVSEVNCLGYYVERKCCRENSFTSVSPLIPGAGSSLDEHSYSWVDEHTAAGTYYYRLRQVDLDNKVTYSSEIKVVVNGAMDVSDDKKPSVFALRQNFPNPFNPTTNFGFQIADRGFVTLRVFDILGQAVATPVNETKAPGTYRISWDAGRLASGVYYYRLDAASSSDPSKHFSETKRMLLVK